MEATVPYKLSKLSVLMRGQVMWLKAPEQVGYKLRLGTLSHLDHHGTYSSCMHCFTGEDSYHYCYHDYFLLVIIYSNISFVSVYGMYFDKNMSVSNYCTFLL